jgi:hydroxyquinol 1,2-dioxygenase
MRNLDEHTITAEVLGRIGTNVDARLRAILQSAVRHLHEFAREIDLTEAEWLTGIQFLTRTGRISSNVRQEMVLLSDTLGLSQLVVAQSHRRPPATTEQTVLGPFHVDGAPIRASHGSTLADNCPGSPLFVSALVTNSASAPQSGAQVDFWQADNEGHYDVQKADWEMSRAQLRGAFRTDPQGRFSFRSVMPRSYPIPTDGPVGEMMRATTRSPMRPAHVHFKIAHPGFDTLVTHVFVDGDPYLDTDCVFGVRSTCVATFTRRESGIAPDGSVMNAPFHTLDYTFILHESD